jgi:hypothetical protein
VIPALSRWKWSSLKSLGYRLSDEEHKKLVGFDHISVYLASQTSF